MLSRFSAGVCRGDGSFLDGGFPKIRGALLGVPILRLLRLRIVVLWGLYWGPPILGNYLVLLGDSRI